MLDDDGNGVGFWIRRGQKRFVQRLLDGSLAEYLVVAENVDGILDVWECAWKIVFDSLATLTDADLGRTILIRGERHSVMQAINRQIAHYAYHIGQIVYIAKHYSADRWRSLSIPRGKSSDFNSRVSAGLASQR